MFDDKVVKGLDFPLPGLSSEEHFAGLKVLGILMVALGYNLGISHREILTELLHCLDNCQVLRMVHVIFLFGRRAFSRVEIDLANNPESIVLVKNARDFNVTCLGLQIDWVLRVDMVKNHCGSEGHFDLSKCQFGIPSQFPLP